MDNIEQSPHPNQQDIEDSFDADVTLVPTDRGGDDAQLDISISSMVSMHIAVDDMEIDDADSSGDKEQEWNAQMSTPRYVSSARDSPVPDSPTSRYVSSARDSPVPDSPTFTPNMEELDYETKNSMVVILKNIVQHTKFCFSDINTVVKCFTESSAEVRYTLQGMLAVGIMNLFHNEHASPQSVSAICRFTALVAIRAHQEEECHAPFGAVQIVVDTFVERPEAYCRIRSCELITWMLTTASESSEFLDDVQENKLPSVPVLQWCIHLCHRRVDKDALVRCAALKAIARLHLERFFDHNGKQSTPFSQICCSLNDISPEVRKTAIQLIPLLTRDHIEMAIRYLGYQDEVTAMRVQMAERITNDVHLKSFTERQKIAFLSQLYYDKDEDVKSLLGTKVVGAWLRALAHDDLDPMEEEENDSLPAHPITLLKYLNCVKHEKIVVITIKLALSHFLNLATGSRTDPMTHLEFLRRMPKAYRSALLHKKSLTKEIQADRSDLHQKIFMHRCLMEFLTGLCADSPANKEIVVSRLLPNALELSTLFQDYATKIFAGTPSVNQLFVFYQILHLLRLTDLDCSVGRKAYEDALKMVIAEESVSSPLEAVDYAMDEVWKFVVKGDEFDRDEFVDWSGFAAGRLLDSVASLESQATQSDMRTYSEEECHLVLRAATIVHCVLRQSLVTTLSPLMRSAFQRISIPLACAVPMEGRRLFSKLIGLAALLDSTGSIVKNHIITFRHSLMNDHMEIKVVTYQAFADVCLKYGWGVISKHAFPERGNSLACRDDLAAIPEQLVCFAPASKFLPAVVFDSCRMLHKFIWPRLMGTIFFRLFDGTADSETENTARVFFTGFAERGLGAKIELIAGFFACCGVVEENAGSLRRFRFGGLMSFVCDLINRKLKKEPVKKLPNGTTLDTVFAMNLLKKIGADPLGAIQPNLACVCLNAINVTKIVKGDARQVLETAASVHRRLKDDDSLTRMKLAVGKFMKVLEKQNLNQPLRRTPRRYVPLKLEEPDLDFDTDEEEYYARPKRSRLSRAEGSESAWSRSDETIKEEVFTQQVKQEIVDRYWQEPEAIIIDSEHDDNEVTMISVRTPRSRGRPRKRPVLEDA